MNWTESEIGQQYLGDGFLMFFGNKAGSVERIQQAYPHFKFRFLNQVHGVSCVESAKTKLEADAHYTTEKEVALCILTADCTPVLVANSNMALAIHAGWRGALNNILAESMKIAFPKGSSPASVSFGPHIQKQSFQVDAVLGNEFSHSFDDKFVSVDPLAPSKSYVDLTQVLLSQLEAEPDQVWTSEVDTLSQDQYHSHRAEPDNKGRNISFVARL